MYLTQFVYGAIEVPAKLIVYYLLEKIGRRKTEAGAHLLAGISLMINIFVPKGETGKTIYDYTISHEHESCCSRITKHDCFYTTDTVNKPELRLHYILDIILTVTVPCLLFALPTQKATAKCCTHMSNTVVFRS